MNSTLTVSPAATEKPHVSKPARTPRPWGSFLGMVIVAAFAMVWGAGGGADRYELFVAIQFLAFVTAAAGINILYGYSGLVSLGHGTFFAIGAYGLGWGLLNTTVPSVVIAIVVLIGSALIAMVLVLPTLRVHGHFLAMVTVAYASVVHVVLVNWESVTGGALGLNLAPRSISVWVPADEVLFIWALVLCVLALMFMRFVRTSALGRAWRTMRQSETAAACLGVPVRRLRVLAFVVSAAMVTLGGMIYGLNVGFLTPAEYDVMLSINLIFAVIVGGSGRLLGPVLGAAIIVVGPEFFRFLGDHRELVLGIVLLGFLSFQRGGIVGAIEFLMRPFLALRRTSKTESEAAR